ncbi:MAG: CCA tRNA nucleotidyltransferase [Lachnospiraceae bacterium]|jgi:tRNA nucleotidyltransferase (CCA-adding enzyme)|nr:CCA tRNA nucleotidyltransferase [Lachnospiraceae bacterium]
MTINLPEKVNNIIRTLEAAGHEAYAVGGCVRDLILDRKPEDWDITTSATPDMVKKLFRRTFDTGIAHGTVTVLSDGGSFEVTTYRVDGAYTDKRRPEEVTFTSSLTEDLRRRDFTINAIAMNEREGLVDPHGGLLDIEQKLIRCVGSADERFSEDALRMMRAVRFAAQLGYEIEENTRQAITSHAASIKDISAERVRDELVKLALSPNPHFLRLLYSLGLTTHFFPEFDLCMETEQNNPHHCYSVGEHILESMKYVAADKSLRLTMMLHDIGKPLTRSVNEKTGFDRFHGHPQQGAEIAKKIMRRLKFDNDTIDRVYRLVYHHDYDIDINPDIDLRHFKITDRYVRRAVSVIGADLYPLFIDVKIADIRAQSEYFQAEKLAYMERARQVYERIMAANECVSLKELAVNGKDLTDGGIASGPRIGQILRAMLDDVIEYPEHNKRGYLLANLQKYM